MKILFTWLISLSIMVGDGQSSTEQYVEDLFDQSYAALDSDMEASLSYAKEAFAIAEDKGFDWHQANALFIQGYVFHEQGQHSKAILLYLDAVRILEQLSDDRSKKDQTKILINCANILRDHHKYDDAIELYDDALSLANNYQYDGYEKRLIMVFYNKSSTYKIKGEYDLAIEEAMKAHDLAVIENDQRMVVQVWNKIGLINYLNNHYDEAIKYYQTILESSFPAIDVRSHKANAYHNIAEVQVELKNFDEAEKSFLKAIDLYQSIQLNRNLFVSYKQLCALYLAQKKYDSAREMGDLALAIYDEMPLEFDNFSLFKLLSDLNFQTGQYAQVKEFGDRYHDENQAFIEETKFISQQSNAFKIDVVLAGYYEQIASREQVASLTNWLIAVLLLALTIIGLGYWRWKWIKTQLEAELRAHFKELAEIFTPINVE